LLGLLSNGFRRRRKVMGKSKRLEAIEECRMEMENLIDVPEV